MNGFVKNESASIRGDDVDWQTIKTSIGNAVQNKYRDYSGANEIARFWDAPSGHRPTAKTLKVLLDDPATFFLSPNPEYARIIEFLPQALSPKGTHLTLEGLIGENLANSVAQKDGNKKPPSPDWDKIKSTLNEAVRRRYDGYGGLRDIAYFWNAPKASRPKADRLGVLLDDPQRYFSSLDAADIRVVESLPQALAFDNNLPSLTDLLGEPLAAIVLDKINNASFKASPPIPSIEAVAPEVIISETNFPIETKAANAEIVEPLSPASSNDELSANDISQDIEMITAANLDAASEDASFEAQSDADNGDYFSSPSFQKLYNIWASKKASHPTNTKSIVKRFVASLKEQGVSDFRLMKPEHVSKYIAELMDDWNLKDSTRKAYRFSVRDFANFLGKQISETGLQLDGLDADGSEHNAGQGAPVTTQTASSNSVFLKNYIWPLDIQERWPSPADVIQIVADSYNLTTDDLIGEERLASIVRPRHMAMYIVKENCLIDEREPSWSEIAKIFGGRESAGISPAVQKIQRLIDASDPIITRELNRVMKRIHETFWPHLSFETAQVSEHADDQAHIDNTSAATIVQPSDVAQFNPPVDQDNSSLSAPIDVVPAEVLAVDSVYAEEPEEAPILSTNDQNESAFSANVDVAPMEPPLMTTETAVHEPTLSAEAGYAPTENTNEQNDSVLNEVIYPVANTPSNSTVPAVIRKERLSAADVQKLAARYYNLDMDDMLSERRLRRIVQPRQITMFVIKEHCQIAGSQISLPGIGRVFGGKHHTTVLAALRNVEKLVRQGDKQTITDIEFLRAAIKQQIETDNTPLEKRQSSVANADNAISNNLPALSKASAIDIPAKSTDTQQKPRESYGAASAPEVGIIAKPSVSTIDYANQTLESLKNEEGAAIEIIEALQDIKLYTVGDVVSEPSIRQLALSPKLVSLALKGAAQVPPVYRTALQTLVGVNFEGSFAERKNPDALLPAPHLNDAQVIAPDLSSSDVPNSIAPTLKAAAVEQLSRSVDPTTTLLSGQAVSVIRNSHDANSVIRNPFQYPDERMRSYGSFFDVDLDARHQDQTISAREAFYLSRFIGFLSSRIRSEDLGINSLIGSGKIARDFYELYGQDRNCMEALDELVIFNNSGHYELTRAFVSRYQDGNELIAWAKKFSEQKLGSADDGVKATRSKGNAKAQFADAGIAVGSAVKAIRLDSHDYAKNKLRPLLGALKLQGIETEAQVASYLNKNGHFKWVASISKFFDGHLAVIVPLGTRNAFAPIATILAKAGNIKTSEAYRDTLRSSREKQPSEAISSEAKAATVGRQAKEQAKPAAKTSPPLAIMPDSAILSGIEQLFPTLRQKMQDKGIPSIERLCAATFERIYNPDTDTRQKLSDLVRGKLPYNPKNGELIPIAKMLQTVFGDNNLFPEYASAEEKVISARRQQQGFAKLMQEYAIFGQGNSSSKSTDVNSFTMSLTVKLRHLGGKALAKLPVMRGLYAGDVLPIEDGRLRNEALMLMDIFNIPSKKVSAAIPEFANGFIYSDTVRYEFPNLATLMRRNQFFTVEALAGQQGNGMTDKLRQDIYAKLNAENPGVLRSDPEGTVVQFLVKLFKVPPDILLADEKTALPPTALQKVLKKDAVAG